MPLLAVGGGNSTPSTSESTQAFVSGSGSVTAGSVISLTDGSTTLATFTVPDNYKSSGMGGGPGGPGGGPGSRGGPIFITCAGLTSGSSYTLTNGSSTSSVTAALKGSSGGRPW